MLAVIGEPSEASGDDVGGRRGARPRIREPEPAPEPEPPSRGRRAEGSRGQPAAAEHLVRGGPGGGSAAVRYRGDAAGPGRERHGGNGQPLAQAGRRHRRGRRAAAGDLHRQGRHRDPLPHRRHHAGDPGAEDETVEVGAVLAVIGEPVAGTESAPEAEAPASETAQADGADTVEEQTAAGDEGGQAPIPASPSRAPRPEPEPEQRAAEPQAKPARRPRPSRACGRRRGRSRLRDPAGAQAGGRARRRPGLVTGTGVGGRIRKQDVLAAAEEAKKAAEAPAPAAGRRAARPRRRRRRSRRPSRQRCAAPPRR